MQARAFPFDLHVLSTPPAFILSQDQTLQQKKVEQAKNSSNKKTKKRKRKCKQKKMMASTRKPPPKQSANKSLKRRISIKHPHEVGIYRTRCISPPATKPENHTPTAPQKPAKQTKSSTSTHYRVLTQHATQSPRSEHIEPLQKRFINFSYVASICQSNSN